jgi:hypothetical protein
METLGPFLRAWSEHQARAGPTGGASHRRSRLLPTRAGAQAS